MWFPPACVNIQHKGKGPWGLKGLSCNSHEPQVYLIKVNIISWLMLLTFTRTTALLTKKKKRKEEEKEREAKQYSFPGWNGPSLSCLIGRSIKQLQIWCFGFQSLCVVLIGNNKAEPHYFQERERWIAKIPFSTLWISAVRNEESTMISREDWTEKHSVDLQKPSYWRVIDAPEQLTVVVHLSEWILRHSCSPNKDLRPEYSVQSYFYTFLYHLKKVCL